MESADLHGVWRIQLQARSALVECERSREKIETFEKSSFNCCLCLWQALGTLIAISNMKNMKKFSECLPLNTAFALPAEIMSATFFKQIAISL